MADIRIVILQRGWVMIGKYHRVENDCYLSNASVIRRWGANTGLGELAKEGKLSETILDPCGEVEFHILTVIASIKCDPKKWEEIC